MDMGSGMSYTMIDGGEGTGGGMMKHPMPGAPSAWLAYVNVDNVAAATAKAKSLGATVSGRGPCGLGDNNKNTDCDGQDCRVHEPLPIRSHVRAGGSATEIGLRPATVCGA
jgi:predicted enzyme related to lactoylglutathione lyase